jgi:uncharacterized protein
VRIYELLWSHESLEHIARHGVQPEELEEVCSGRPLVLRTKGKGINPVYLVLGETEAGRLLAGVVIRFPDGKGLPVTARPMTDRERRRYGQWRR